MNIDNDVCLMFYVRDDARKRIKGREDSKRNRYKKIQEGSKREEIPWGRDTN